jgi:hypothetical protein
MLLYRDVEDDLIEAYPQYYSRVDGVLVYHNGLDSPKYIVGVNVWNA